VDQVCLIVIAVLLKLHLFDLVWICCGLEQSTESEYVCVCARSQRYYFFRRRAHWRRTCCVDNGLRSFKPAFHDTDTDILANSPDTPTSLRGSSRGCRCRCRGMRPLPHADSRPTTNMIISRRGDDTELDDWIPTCGQQWSVSVVSLVCRDRLRWWWRWRRRTFESLSLSLTWRHFRCPASRDN